MFYLIAIIALRRTGEELIFMRHTHYWTRFADDARLFDLETAQYEVKQLRKRSNLRYTIVPAADHVSQPPLL